MKKLLSLICFLPIIALAQLQPTIGGKFTGGLSYDMEHEYFSGQIGLMQSFDNAKFDNVSISGEYIYDYLQYFNGKHNFYILRLQTANKFSELFSVTYYGGYINNFNNDLMSQFKGGLKTNLAWGAGIRVNSDYSFAEVIYENLAGYPHISVGIHFKLWKLTR